MGSYALAATWTVTIRRQAQAVGTRRGPALDVATGLAATPFEALTSQVMDTQVQARATETPHRFWQTLLETDAETELRAGDVVVVTAQGGAKLSTPLEYPVQTANAYPWRGGRVVWQLIVEELAR